MRIAAPQHWTDWSTGSVSGRDVVTARRVLADLEGWFADEDARAAMDPDQLVYTTECVFPVAEGTSGGLFWGTTFIQPGDVAGECFMTKGHFHSQRDRMEAYFTFTGTGVLLLMDDDRRCRAEEMTPGSLHLVAPNTAHRTINVGADVFAFGACWPSDAGHDYETIAREGFAARVFRDGDSPNLVPA